MNLRAPTIVDMHSHYYGGLVDALKRRTSRPTVTVNQRGQPVLNAMTASTVMTSNYTDIDARIAYIDRAGIQQQLLTFPGSLGVDVLPIDESWHAVVDYNDHLAEVCRRSNNRFIGLAGLPLADMAKATEEMKRARRALGLIGAILPGNYFLSLQSAEELTPVFAAADAEGALVMVHPGLMPDENSPEPYPDNSILRASALNLQASLAHMALTLIAGRFPERYPNVTFQVVNLGGTLPFIMERIDAIAASRELPAKLTVEGLRRLVYDSASLGVRALEIAVKVMGADRLMLGTDCPIFEPASAADCVLRADLSPDEKAAILGGTAQRLVAALS